VNYTHTLGNAECGVRNVESKTKTIPRSWFSIPDSALRTPHFSNHLIRSVTVSLSLIVLFVTAPPDSSN
jgi:hypothetical protein